VTPRQFEAARADRWQELEQLLEAAEESGKDQGGGARLAALYRLGCEDLALAQSRSYPIHLTQRLEAATQRAHRLIYRRHGLGLAALRRLALVDFPAAVRAHSGYVLLAAALFVLPMLAVGWASWRDPGFILHLLDVDKVQQFDAMYGPGEESIGRERGADTDWQMFGMYVMHNIGIAFQCFAAGIFAGLGSAFFLLFNGLMAGSVGGFLIARGHGENFLSFVVTHTAFEVTALVLAGAAGLRLGHAWLAPGRLTRLHALRLAARESVVVVYGVVGLLLVAAAVEAFWSSSRWIPPEVKYGVGGACWALVLAYLAAQGRPAARAGAPRAR